VSSKNDAVSNVKSIYLASKTQWADATEESEECYRFVLNEQWNDSEIDSFLKQGCPPIQYNLILPRINNVIGTEQLNRRSIKIRPYYSSQRELADILTGVMDNVWETERGEDELSKCFADGLIMTRPGCFKIRVEPDFAGFFDYKYESLNPMSVWFDPNYRDYTLRDCQYIIQETWLRLDQIIETYGNRKEYQMEGYGKKWWERLSETINEGINSLFGDGDSSSEFYDRKRNLFKVLEMQTRVTVPRELFMDTKTGDYLMVEKGKANDMAQAGLYHVGETKTTKIHITTVSPYFNLVLFDEDNWLDTDMYDIIPYTSFDLNNIKSQSSSLVKAMLDPQKNLNKREIQKTSYIDRAMVAPMAFSYEDRDTKEDYDENGTMPHYSMLVRNLKFPPHRLSPSQMTGDVWNDIADAKDKMNDISGINETARGQSEYSHESARLFQMKSDRVAATINPYFKTLNKTRMMIGRYHLQTFRQVYPELNRIVSVLDAQKNAKTAVLNLEDGETIRNKVSSFLGQVVLDEGERSVTKLQENIEKKFALVGIMPPELINWAWILEDSELPDVEKQIQYIDMVMGIKSEQSAMEQQVQLEQFAQQAVLANEQTATAAKQAQIKSTPAKKGAKK
jgi:hypothetical protein